MRKKEVRKMKTEELKTLGLTEEQISAVMAANGKDVTAEKAKYDTIKTDYESVKTQLTTANTTIDGFKDYDEIKGKVTQYQTDLVAANAKADQIKSDYEFTSKLTEAAKKHGAKNVKAVIPFLDVETLKLSKNQEADIETKFAALKAAEDTSFIFGANEPILNGVAPTGAGGGKVLDAFTASLMQGAGLQNKEK